MLVVFYISESFFTAFSIKGCADDWGRRDCNQTLGGICPRGRVQPTGVILMMMIMTMMMSVIMIMMIVFPATILRFNIT